LASPDFEQKSAFESRKSKFTACLPRGHPPALKFNKIIYPLCRPYNIGSFCDVIYRIKGFTIHLRELSQFLPPV
jgi:hypothetical protein